MISEMTAPSGEPGGRLPAPDPELRLLQAFVNTADMEEGRDALRDRRLASQWLIDNGLVERSARLTAPEHRRLLQVREVLRRLGSANNGELIGPTERDGLNQTIRSVELVAALGADGRLSIEGHGRPIDHAIGRLFDTLARATASGSWSRMKACQRHSCRWLFWDASRNRSGTWCTMALCGSRQKSSTYRTRRTGAASTSP